MMNFKKAAVVLLITASISLMGNYVGYQVAPWEALPGIAILVTISLTGVAITKILPLKIPCVAYIVTLSTFLTIPGVPFAETISQAIAKVNFLALATPILAYAGVYTGKNVDALKKTGWRIVILSLFVMIGTYLGSAVIAHIILKQSGQI